MAYQPFRNLGLKALAVGLATLLWLTVLGEHVVERGVRAPLEFRNIPETLEIMGEPPAAVDVRVRGTSGLLSRLQPGEVVAVLDLASARPGSRLFHLRTDQVQAPYGVEVAQELSQQRLDAAQSKFEVGLATNFEVVQAQRDLADAQNTALRALLDYTKSQVDLERVQFTGSARSVTAISAGGGN